MNWQKQGQLITPDMVDWAESHVQLPLASASSIDESGECRVFFAARKADNLSRIGYADVEIESMSVIEVSPEPVFALGNLGAFDDSAVFPHWLVEHDGETYLYYTGWTQGNHVPYIASIGLARKREDRTGFVRVSTAPVLGRSDADPYLTHSPCVLVEDDTWTMWYASATTWVDGDPPKPRYNLRVATSRDGRAWEPDGTTAIDFGDDQEWALARPCVRRRGDSYEMWYCYSRADQGYRIGYAVSDDGIDWTRRDDAVGLTPSADGWDSEMLAYPYVFTHRSDTYMLYNGNGFGETGVGVAKRT